MHFGMMFLNFIANFKTFFDTPPASVKLRESLRLSNTLRRSTGAFIYYILSFIYLSLFIIYYPFYNFQLQICKWHLLQEREMAQMSLHTRDLLHVLLQRLVHSTVLTVQNQSCIAVACDLESRKRKQSQILTYLSLVYLC